MSTAANWENNEKPVAGDDIDFTIAVPFAAIEADIDATFGKIYLGAGDVPAFSGALATGFAAFHARYGAKAALTFFQSRRPMQSRSPRIGVTHLAANSMIASRCFGLR